MISNGDYPTLDDVRQLLPDVVLLAIETGTKKPTRSKWQKTTFADTQKEGYQRLLANADTIGVLLGAPSNWLSDLDCDTDPYLEFMLTGNEVLQKTLRTCGARAGGIWFRNTNQTLTRVYPLNVQPSSPLAKGGKIDEQTGLVKIGELRCGNGQSIVCGLHPDKINYRWPEIHPPIELDPRTLTWPEEVQSQLPWNQQREKQKPVGKTAGKHQYRQRNDAELLERAQAALSFPFLFQYFGFPDIVLDGNGCWSGSSPFREDNKASFSIHADGTRWKDHGLGGLTDQGDKFDFYQRGTGKNASEAFVEFVVLAGLGDCLRTSRRPATDAEFDPRPLIVHPGEDRYVSEFTTDLGLILKDKEFFRFSGRLFHVCTVTEKARSGKEYQTKKLIEIPPLLFAGLIEKYCRPVRDGKYRSISVELAARALPLPHLLDQLPIITSWAEVRTPCLPYLTQMPITLSEPGYDPHTGIYTSQDAPEIDETLGVAEAAECWRTLMSEFCFPKDKSERERCIAVALAAAMAPFCVHLLPESANRPGFLAGANSEGAGKTLLLSFGMVAKLGFVPTGAAPEKEEEMRKVLDSAVHHAVPIIFFDNLQGHLTSTELAGFITTTTRSYRLLGTTNYNKGANLATVFITGNFATFSPDLRRRLLAVELILVEGRAEDRIIRNVLNEEKLIELRPKLLSIFWAMIKEWDLDGRPHGSIVLPSFEQWSQIVGGIIENAGFVSPCLPTSMKTGGDTQTRDMELLVASMVVGTQYKFNQLIELAADNHLFSWLIPPAGVLGRSESSRLSSIFRRALDRIWCHRYRLCLRPGTWRTEAYYIIDLLSEI